MNAMHTYSVHSASMTALTASQRDRFEVISRATFANPFADERDKLDQQIARSDAEGPALLEQVMRAVHVALAEVNTGDGPVLARFTGRDRELVEHALFFEAFHLYRHQLDALIDAQLAAGDEPVPVHFASELRTHLEATGMTSERALRVLEIFYQIQRAHRFVATGLVGHSPCMVKLREALWSNVFTQDVRLYERYLLDRMEDFSTIILGETGSGKGAAAAAIGRSGFIAFDQRKG